MPREGYVQSSRYVVMYPDCNTTDNLFGGRMLSWADQGAAIYASCQMKTNRIVTAAFGEVKFKVPVERGKIVIVYCKNKRVGAKSLTVSILVTKMDFSNGDEIDVLSAEIVFVAVDEQGKSKVWNPDAVTNNSWPKGWGYDELAEHWNIPGWKDVKDSGKQSELAQLIGNYMLDSMALEDSKNQDGVVAEEHMHKVAADLRVFLYKLASEEEGKGYMSPFWRGLAGIEHDGQLLKTASGLVEKMWS